ncbi:hypothetical protein NQ317_017274 [Molorchus minor]|uniref:Uncharacterized protein n=1 Tax=Molorchus minor TaxID=1323400 RepID=A0ABQ9JSD1_9CUCU|nr:hypothetical protein NQ317_017274 [Molorchus minor]
MSNDAKETIIEQIKGCNNFFFYRQDLLKWNGWGYNDSKFYFKDGEAYFSSNRADGGICAQYPRLKPEEASFAVPKLEVP